MNKERLSLLKSSGLIESFNNIQHDEKVPLFLVSYANPYISKAAAGFIFKATKKERNK